MPGSSISSRIEAVSVVIPCHNAGRWLAASARSAASGQGLPTEVIVVDDGSTDDTVAVAESLELPLRLIRQTNQGVAAARNAGVRAASHEWIAFLDADDIWLPGKLAAQAHGLQAHGQAAMSCTAWEVWPSAEPQPPAPLLKALQQECGLHQDPAHRVGPSGWIYPELLLDCVVWTSTVLVHRSVLETAGGFEVGCTVGEDYDLWLRLSRITPILRVHRPYALYRLHGHNTTVRMPQANHKAEVISRALSRWGYAGPDGRCADPAAVRRGLARSWADYGGSLHRAGRRSQAFGAAVRSLAYNIQEPRAWAVALKASLPLVGRSA